MTEIIPSKPSPGSQPGTDSIGRTEFEAALMGQEHRLFRILLNYWNRKQFSVDDPRYRAVQEALVRRILAAAFAPAVAGGAGILALLTLWLAWQSNQLVQDQNILIEQQNYKLNVQAKLAQDEQRLEKMRFSVFHLMNLSTEWYKQLHSMATWDPEVQATLDPQARGLYVENRDVVPEYKLHVLILKQGFPECSHVVAEAEHILVLLTDYDRDNPAKRIICSSIYDIPDWEHQLLPKLDTHLQALAMHSAAALGPNLNPPVSP